MGSLARYVHMLNFSAPYDLVGQYNQDEINGFDPLLIERLLDIARLEGSSRVLDAMAGDGNLSHRLLRYCEARGMRMPELTVLEFSRVQAEMAKESLQRYNANVLWGDILEMRSLTDGSIIAPSSFDRVLIKSANHEIPLSSQPRLYRNIFDVLSPDGLFVNLGFLFDDEEERDELREIARTKDSLAGLEMAVQNRHFLTRSEFYDCLRKAGFVDIETAHAFMYSIRSEIVAKRYFKTEVVEQDSLEFQIAQLRAKTMRKKGRIRFEADATVMECPGEITVARRPTAAEENQSIYKRYPYDFLRHIRVHREMLAQAAAFVPDGSRVLDAGCGIGLLAERVADRCSHYLAVDINPQFVEICRSRMRSVRQMETVVGDLNNFRVDSGDFDCILSLNVLYQEGIHPEAVLIMMREALRPGGTLILTGPMSPKSFERCEAQLLADLEEEGALSGKEEIARQIRMANERLLSAKAHYWSAGEMAELVMGLGFSKLRHIDQSLYYGNAWLIVVER
jgi:SAM-dependent methyltransferase